MSQNRQSLDLVERISGYQGMILRPLSAKLLSLTIPEQKGWVNREMLLNLSGRSRKPQIAMAKELGIQDYPVPAGGCLLTDSIFSQRLKDLFLYNPDTSVNDLELLKLGRHFRLGPFTKIIIGRNMEENTRILELAKETDVVIHNLSVPGPVALISGEHSDEIIKRGAEMNASYCNEKLEEIDMVIVEKDISGTIKVYGKEKSEFRHLMI
jgi:hypothetical protein